MDSVGEGSYDSIMEAHELKERTQTTSTRRPRSCSLSAPASNRWPTCSQTSPNWISVRTSPNAARQRDPLVSSSPPRPPPAFHVCFVETTPYKVT